MMKWLLIGGGLYLYFSTKQQLNAAIADRTALLTMLTPAQQAALTSALQTAAGSAQTAIQGSTIPANTPIVATTTPSS